MTSQTESQAIANRTRILAELAQAEADMRALEERITKLEDEAYEADRAVDAARAAAASDTFEPGTRVHHRTFTDALGTVVESDGRGIAVRQDGSTVADYGFGPGEWVAVS